MVEVSLDSLFSNTNNIDDSGLLKNDPDKNYWLNVLGYNVPIAEDVSRDRLTEKPELRQLGSVMHSTPIQLTQEGRVYVDSNNQIKTEKRKRLSSVWLNSRDFTCCRQHGAGVCFCSK